CGLWTGFKIVTSVADAAGTAEVGPDRVAPIVPEVMWNGRPYVHRPNATMLAPDSLVSERTLLNIRLDIAREYARLNHLNTIELPTKDAWLGIVAAGKTYRDLRQALNDLGL